MKCASAPCARNATLFACTRQLIAAHHHTWNSWWWPVERQIYFYCKSNCYIHVRENRRGNGCTIPKHSQHWSPDIERKQTKQQQKTPQKKLKQMCVNPCDHEQEVVPVSKHSPDCMMSMLPNHYLIIYLFTKFAILCTSYRIVNLPYAVICFLGHFILH